MEKWLKNGFVAWMFVMLLSTFTIVGYGTTLEPDFNNMFDGHGSVMLLIDSGSGEIVYANQAAEKFYGYTGDQLTQMKITDINTLSPEETIEEMALAVEQARNYFLFTHRLADGSLREVEVYSYPYRYGDREMLYSIIHDVTAEIVLARSNRRMTFGVLGLAGVLILGAGAFIYLTKKKNNLLEYQSKALHNFNNLRKNFIDADNRLTYLKDSQLKYVFVNQAFENFFDTTEADVMGKDAYHLAEKDFADFITETDLEALEKRDTVVRQTMWRGRLVKLTKFPIAMMDDSFGVGAYLEDVTDQVKAIEAEEKSKVRNVMLVDVLLKEFDSTEEQLTYALKKALELTESSYGYIFAYDEEQETFHLETWSGEAMPLCDEVDKPTVYHLNETGLWGEVVRQGKPIIDNDYQSPGSHKRGYPVGHVAITRFLSIPIYMEGKIVAAVAVANKEQAYLDQDVNELILLMNGIWLAKERREKRLALREANHQLHEQKDELQLILDSAAEGIMGLDLEGKMTFCNQSSLKMLGYDRQEELVGHNLHVKIHHSHEDGTPYPEDACKMTQAIAEGKNIQVQDEIFWRKDGTFFHVNYFVYPQFVDNQLVGSVVTFIDITERLQMEQAIYIEKEQFRTTLLSVGDAVIATDNNGHIRIMNPIAEKLTGWTIEEALGKPSYRVFNIVNEYTGDPCENPVARVLETGQIIELENHTLLISKSGEALPIEDSAAPIRNKEDRITGVVIVFRDFTDKREKLREIEYLSFHDHLTGLYNRRYMEDSIQRLDVARNLPFAVMAVDVNGLKLTNDAFGHEMGDRLLKQVADMLKTICREDDIIGRMGGDEFLLLLPKTTESQAKNVKMRILQHAEQIKLETVIVSLAVGYAVKESSEVGIKEVMTIADNNMYKDKLRYGKIMRSKTIETVLKNINMKYDQEQIHTERVSQYCVALGKAMGMDDRQVEALRVAGVLHDIGKIMVPPELLNKKGRLTPDEFEIVKRHPETSYQILKSVDEYAALAEDVLYHHERMDGKGYPEGLVGEEVPLNSRIIAVADAFEAMTADRPYQKPKTKEEAIEELKRCAGTQFDAPIVETFIEVIS